VEWTQFILKMHQEQGPFALALDVGRVGERWHSGLRKTPKALTPLSVLCCFLSHQQWVLLHSW
jgi:hypothetical protein